MAVISLADAWQYAKNAGFTGIGLVTIVAIAEAESGLDTTIVNPKDPNGGSFGILQINGAHGLGTDVTFDPQKSFDFAFQLSKQGTDFTPWSTYTSGRFLQQDIWAKLGMSYAQAQETATLGAIQESGQLAQGTHPGTNANAVTADGGGLGGLLSGIINNIGNYIDGFNPVNWFNGSGKNPFTATGTLLGNLFSLLGNTGLNSFLNNISPWHWLFGISPGGPGPLPGVVSTVQNLGAAGSWLDPVRIAKLAFGALLLLGAIILIAGQADKPSQVATAQKGLARLKKLATVPE